MTVTSTSELRLPAHPDYIVVAKRAAAGFACVAGFDVEACDDLVIAVAQACENAIAAANGQGELHLSFRLQDRRLDVRVRSTRMRPQKFPEMTGGPPPQATVGTRSRTERPTPSWMPPRRSAPTALEQAAAVHDLALRVMGLFVDDCQYHLDERTGGLRVRLTKYRVS